MSDTIRKGNIGVAKIIADLTTKGLSISGPLDEGTKYDLIADDTETLIRIQCTYTESDGSVIVAYPNSRTHVGFRASKRTKYTHREIDYLAVYDATTDQCFYIHSSELGKGMSSIHLRLKPAANGQEKGVRWAKDHMGL